MVTGTPLDCTNVSSTCYFRLGYAQSGDVAAPSPTLRPSPSLKLLPLSVCKRFCRSSYIQADTLPKPSSRPSSRFPRRYLPVMALSSSGKIFSRDMEHRPDTSRSDVTVSHSLFEMFLIPFHCSLISH
jgi:hypothetical protein